MNEQDVEFELAAQEAFSEQEAVPQQLAQLGPRLLDEFAKAELDRRQTEERWLSDLRQYKGVYDPDVLAAIGPVRSRAFVRKTRVKVKTVDSRVADLLFPAGAEKNWTIEPTPKPRISKEQRAAIVKQLQAMVAQSQQAAAQMGQAVPPVRLSNEQINEAVLEFSKQAAKKMSTTIDDQLVEARYKEVCIKAIHSGHLYGTGILKGPLIERKVRTRFVMEGGRWVTRSEEYVVPFVDFVPLWRFYPDMSATQIADCRYIFERHQMTQSDLAGLADRKSFRRDVIVEYIKSHPRGELRTRYIDNELKIIGQRNATQGHVDGQYEVLERWGYVSGGDLKQAGIEVPEDRVHESFFSNIWLLPNGVIIKAVLQPINGVTWPYHMYSFDKDETSLFGEGIASIMRDDQTNLNASVRMMLDNGAISSGPMVEVNPRLLTSYERVNEMAPWKVWLRNSEQPGQRAVNAIDLPNHLAELQAMAAMFETNADETTAIPRYMTGDNVSQGAAGTASGMSMLMGAANIVIKDLVTAWDEGVTRTFLSSLYHWNMQFSADNSIKGDFDVKARGTASMVAKEVRGRQLGEFTASVSNPMDAPYIKRDKLLMQRAEANELADVVKTQEEVDKEMSAGPAAAQMQFQQQMQELQLATAQANAAKVQAEAQRIAAEAALAEIKATSLKVESVYAALQAAGVAVTSPHIAPAGDEILRSAGWKDATPDPTISNLMSPEVQDQSAQVAMGGDMTAMPPMQAQPAAPASPVPALQPQTGHVGQQAGIETVANDGAVQQ